MPTGDLIETTAPCPEPNCDAGWNVDELDYCGTCRGTGEVEVEVYEGCGHTERECRCAESRAVGNGGSWGDKCLPN